jgi:murein DD-endopeptidase MepM/ murein hydrolase activator NlpD
MNRHQQLADYIFKHPDQIGKVVDFDAAEDRLLQFNFMASNNELSAEGIADTARFSNWVNLQLKQNHCRYGIGGYMEHRTLYARSALFDTDGEEPRRLHLGMDIWAAAGTPVYAPLQGTVHSFQNNDRFGDYGPTIILQHDLDGLMLYSLYGHLNADCLNHLQIDQTIEKNQQIAAFGTERENGSWPPHLHFQLMFDMQGKAGDYPGVCRFTERDQYQQNVPDPDLILNFNKANSF